MTVKIKDIIDQLNDLVKTKVDESVSDDVFEIVTEVASLADVSLPEKRVNAIAFRDYIEKVMERMQTEEKDTHSRLPNHISYHRIGCPRDRLIVPIRKNRLKS